jgi:hypothetical protein
MTRIIATALAICAGTLAVASEDGEYGMDGDKRAAIENKLTDMGYEVRKIEREDGMYEAYALKDGARYEIYLDGALDITRKTRDD